MKNCECIQCNCKNECKCNSCECC